MVDREHLLEPSREVQERWLTALARFALDHMAGLEKAPATGPLGSEAADIAESVSRPIGEEPLPGAVDEVIQVLDRAAGASLNAPGPGYFAYIPGGGIYTAALADFVADCLNRYTGMSAPSPALFRLEQDVLSWLCRSFGYGPSARAVLTPGGSLANLEAVVTARFDRFGDSGRFDQAIVYTSTQAHHSIAKAVRLAGIPPGNVRAVAVDERFRMRVDALATAIREDKDRGATPFLVIAAAGTTNTGAIDPLGPVADLASKESLWVHVDGAYGGAFALCDQGRARLSGIERADSITFDPHKGMFLPYGTGCLLVREGQKLQRAHHLGAEYLQDLEAHAQRRPVAASSGDAAGQAEPTSWSPAELGSELSRDFRGLRLWLPLMLHGAGAFRDALTEKLALADRFVEGLEGLVAAGAPIEIVARPQLSLVAFRVAQRANEPLAEWNARNAAFLSAINTKNRVHLSSTLLAVPGGNAFTLRVCVLSFRSHARHIDWCLEDVASALSEMADGKEKGG